MKELEEWWRVVGGINGGGTGRDGRIGLMADRRSTNLRLQIADLNFQSAERRFGCTARANVRIRAGKQSAMRIQDRYIERIGIGIKERRAQRGR